MSHVTKYDFLEFKMADDHYIKNTFLAIPFSQLPISVKLCVGKQFFVEFRQWDR